MIAQKFKIQQLSRQRDGEEKLGTMTLAPVIEVQSNTDPVVAARATGRRNYITLNDIALVDLDGLDVDDVVVINVVKQVTPT